MYTFFALDFAYSSMVSALSSRLTIDVEDEGGLLGDGSFPRAHCDRSSIGKGNIMVEKLGPGSVFPSMTLQVSGGGSIDLPDHMDGKYNVVLFYRGHW